MSWRRNRFRTQSSSPGSGMLLVVSGNSRIVDRRTSKLVDVALYVNRRLFAKARPAVRHVVRRRFALKCERR